MVAAETDPPAHAGMDVLRLLRSGTAAEHEAVERSLDSSLPNWTQRD